MARLLLPETPGESAIRRVTALVLSVWMLLTGCTGSRYPSYSQPGPIETDFTQDSCAQDSQAAGASTVLGSEVAAQREATRHRMCMEARGWTAE